MMAKPLVIILLSLAAASSLFSHDEPHPIYIPKNKTDILYDAWFTGPLLTPSPTTPLPGHPVLEVESLILNFYGNYTQHGKIQKAPAIWSVANYIDYQMGFNQILGMEIYAAPIAGFSSGTSSINFSDTTVRIGFQISHNDPHSWVPDFRILLEETFPTGNYQKLNPRKNFADLTGHGSYETGLYLVFQKSYFPKNNHTYNISGSLGYLIPSATHVTGINYYGGAPDTRGKVFPGNFLIAFLSGEVALTRQWNVVAEATYLQGAPGKYRRKKGTLPDVSAYNELTVALEAERTFTPSLGILFGIWGTVAGKNMPAFASAFFCVLYQF